MERAPAAALNGIRGRVVVTICCISVSSVWLCSTMVEFSIGPEPVSSHCGFTSLNTSIIFDSHWLEISVFLFIQRANRPLDAPIACSKALTLSFFALLTNLICRIYSLFYKIFDAKISYCRKLSISLQSIPEGIAPKIQKLTLIDKKYE